ncbi:MAG: hypothetical protein PHH77_03430 [Victivallaceae bacterium]|nr:hypothetical protein [Victivallaceae bacterium]
MNILAANLKHLYQRRSCWFFGLFLGFVALPGVLVPELTYIPALWMLYMGTFTAALSIDVLTKPFSYCLPGHRSIPRNFLFSVGLPLSLLWSLRCLFMPDFDFVKTGSACLAAFSTFTICYWAGVWVVFTFRYWTIMWVFFLLLILGNKLLNINVFFVHTILESPLPMILAGTLVNISAWRYWSRPDLARQYCDQLWMGAFDVWNKEKMVKLELARLAERDKKKPDSIRILPGVERFFISGISGAETGSLRQYIWGCLYKSFGAAFSQHRRKWKQFFTITLPIILCFIGYFESIRNVMFFIPAMMVANMDLNVHSSLLISGSRRKRFWSALTLAAVAAVFVTLGVISITVLTHLLELILPELTIKGKTFVFHALDIQLFFVPLLMLPVILTIFLISHKRPALAIFLVTLFLMILIQPFVLVIATHLAPAVIIMLLCGIWGGFAAVLRYISMRRCLVS